MHQTTVLPSSVVWRKRNINRPVYVCVLCSSVYTSIMVHSGTSSSYGSVDWVRLWSCLIWLSVFQAPLCQGNLRFILVSRAWWNWPLTCLTNHWPSVLWHCWLGHLTCKIVHKITYNVLGLIGTLYPILYHTVPFRKRLSLHCLAHSDAGDKCADLDRRYHLPHHCKARL